MLIKRIATHSGTFHCDQVLACVMLTKYSNEYKQAKIIRTRVKQQWQKCDIVVDVSGKYQPPKYFDHHQKQFNKTKMDIKLSSAGLIYQHFNQIIKNASNQICYRYKMTQLSQTQLQKLKQKLYQNFVRGIDANDNGDQRVKHKISVKHCIWDRVARLNKSWYQTSDQQDDKRFQYAMNIVQQQFQNQLKSQLSIFWGLNQLKKAIQNRFKIDSSGQIIFLQKMVSWKQGLIQIQKQLDIQGKLKFVLFEDTNEKSVRVQSIPIKLNSFQSRINLKQSLRGLLPQALKKQSQLQDIIFVHATGFIGGCKSLQSAIKLAKMSLN